MRCGRVAERGLTLTEVVLIVLIVLLTVGILATNPGVTGRSAERQLKDSTQIKAVCQPLLAASDANGAFPLPSLRASASEVSSGRAEASNTSVNLYSMLIQNGQVTSEMLVSPSEVNGAIEVANGDPAFRADFTTGVGNVSYAHLMPSEDRLALWRVDAPAGTPIVGNRGPRVEMKGGELVADAESNTCLIHGSRKSWEGNIAFADGHVDFLTSMTLPNGDHLFFDEPEPGNAHLGIFVEAGKTRVEFRAIWD